jgi:hypothetical protein
MRHLSGPAALVLLVGLLAGCSGGSDDDPPEPAGTSSSAPPQASTPTPARAAPRPKPNQCYRLAYDDALAPTSHRRPVSCDKQHTATTFHVGTLDAVEDGHLLAVDSRLVQDRVAAECPERMAGFVGGSLEVRRLSMLRAVWFTPTVAQSDRGADWFRCDVIAVAGTERLAPLTGKLEGALDRPEGRTTYGMCGTAEPGAADFERVICSEPHSWRAISTFTFDTERYPGEQRVRSAGESTCEDAGRDVAEDTLSFQWGYEWPTEKQWDEGQTYGRCWAPD